MIEHEVTLMVLIFHCMKLKDWMGRFSCNDSQWEKRSKEKVVVKPRLM